MTWRQRLLIALTAVVGLIVVVPATSGGRTWLLSQVALDLDRSGYTTSYRSSRGVAWGRVTLEDFTITGNGLEIAAEQLKIRHFFPSLLIHELTGEFPLALWADGLSGSVTVSEALQGGGAGSPRLRLLASSLSRVDLAVDAIPFTIPDLELEDIRLEGVLEGFTFEAELSTAEGSAALRGSADLGAQSLELEVIRADLTLARHWWRGAGTGTVTGHLSASRAGVRADFELLSGKADILGRRVTSISGPVRLDLPHIEADLSGQVFGGAVAARGGVDISGKSWSATFHGSPDLRQGADWLADLLGRPDLRGLPLEAEGRARVEVEGSDWREVSLKGEVSGHGQLAERGFDLLGASFSYSTGQSPTVEARATVAGGALEVSLRPEVDGFLLEISGQHIEPLPGLLVNAELSLQGGPDSQASGGGLLLMALADRVVAASIDTSVTPSGWQVSVEAADDRGAMGDGVVVVQGPNLTGQLSVHDLRLPYLLEPVDLTVGAAGPLVALPVEITVGGMSVISAEWEGWRVHADPRGSVRAVIRRSGPSELAGRLGPLGFSGEIDFGSRTVRAEVDLEPVLLEGEAEVRAGLRQASLLWEAGRLDVTGTAQIQAGRIGGVTFGPVEARAQFGASDRLDQFELAGEFITATWEDTSIAVALRGLPLVVADHTLSITGEVSADPDHLEHASFDLAADVAGISIGLAGQSPLLDLTISIPAGSRLPSTDLLTSVPVNLAGVADLSYNSLAVQGEIGPFILHANGELGNNVWSAAASLVATDRQLDATLSSADLALQGGLDLLSLSQVLALPIDFGSSDHLLVDIQGPWSALAGTVTAELALGSTLSTVSLSLDQQSLDVQGQIKAGGQVADLNGRYTLRQGDSPGSFAGNLVTTGTLLQLDGPLDHLSVRGGLDLPAIPGLPLPLLGRIELDGTADLPAGNLHSALSWLATGARLDGKLAVDLLDGNLVLTANLDGPGLDLAFDGQLATLTAAGFDPNPFLDAPELLSPLSGSLSITGEVSADPDHLEHASFDLAADVAGISIGLAGQSPLLDLTISIPAGSRLPSTDLLTSVPVNLAGVADLSYNSLAVQGEIGPFILHANGELGNNVWSAAASLVATDRQLDATLSSADLALQGGLDLLSLSQVLALPIDFGSSDHLLVDIQGPWSALAGTVTAELALGSTLSTVSLSLDQQSLDVQGQIKAGGQVADLNGRYTLRQGDSPGSFAGNLVTTGTLLQLDGPLDHLSVRGGLDLPAIPGLPLPLLGRIELDGTADLPAGNLHSALSWLATGARLDGKLAVDLLDGNLVLTANLDGPGLDLAFDGQLATLTAAGFDPNPFLDAPELLSPLSGSLSITGEVSADPDHLEHASFDLAADVAGISIGLAGQSPLLDLTISIPAGSRLPSTDLLTSVPVNLAGVADLSYNSLAVQGEIGPFILHANGELGNNVWSAAASLVATDRQLDATLSSADLALQGGLDLLSLSQVLALPIDFGSSDHLLVDIQGPWSALAGTVTAELALGSTLSTVSLSLDQQSLDVQGQIKAGGQVADLNGRYTLRQGDSPGSFAGNLVTTGTLLQLDGPLDHLSVRGGLDLPAIPGLPLPLLGRIELDGTADLPAGNLHSALSWLATGARLDGKLAVDLLDGNLVLTANLDGPGLDLAFDGQLATLTAAGFDPNPFLDAPELLSPLSGSLSITGEVSADPDHLEHASFDLAADVAGISIGLAGQSPLLDLTISIPAGSRLPSTDLLTSVPVNLAGVADLSYNSLAVQGEIGPFILHANGELGNNVWSAAASLVATDRQLDATLSSADLALQGGLDLLSLSQVLALPIDFGSSDHLLVDIQGPWSALAGTVTAELALGSTLSTVSLSLDQQSLDVQGQIKAGGQVADLNGRYTLRQGDSPGSFAGNLVTTGTLLQLDGPLDHLSVRGGLDLPAIPGLPLPLLGRIELDGTADLPAGNLHSALSWLATGARLDGKLAVDLLDGNLVLTANLDGPGLDLAFDGQLATLTAAGFDPNPFLDAPELLSPLSGSLSITGEVSADPDHLEHASFDLAADVAGISIGLAGQSPLLDLTISIPAGSRLPSTDLLTSVPVNLAGVADLSYNSLAVQGEIGPFILHANGELGNNVWSAAASLVATDRQLDATLSSADLALQGGLDLLSLSQVLALPIDFGSSDHLLVDIQGPWSALAGTVTAELALGSTLSTVSLSLDQQSLDVQGQIKAGGQVADLNGRYTLRQGDSPGSFAGNLVTTGTLLQLDGPLDHLSVRGGLDLPAIPGLPLPLLGRIELDGTADLPAGNLHSALSWLATGARLDGKLAVDLLDGNLVLTANLDGPGLDLAFDGQLATLTAAGFDPNPFLDAPELLSPLSGSLSFKPASNSWTGELEGKIVFAGNDLGKVRLDGHSLPDNPELSLHFEGLSYDNGAWGLAPFVVDLAYDPASQQILITGGGANLQGGLDRIGGELELDLLAFGVSHKALLLVSNFPHQTRVEGRIEGELVQGEIRLVDQQLELQATIDPAAIGYLPQETGPIRIEASSGLDANWSARLESYLPLPGLPLQLTAEAKGVGLTYSGSGLLASAAPLLPFSFEGNATTARAEADLASLRFEQLAPLFPLPLELAPQGTLVFTTAPEPSLDFALSGQGTLAGEPFALNLVGVDTKAALQMTIAGNDLGEIRLDGYSLSGQGSIPPLSLSGLATVSQNWQLNGDLRQGRVDATLGDSSASLSWQESAWELTVAVVQNAALGPLVADLNGRYTLRQGDSPGSFAGNLVTTGTLLQLDGPLDHLSVRGGLDLPAIPGLPLPLLGRIELDGTADLPAGNLHSALSWLATGARLDGKLAVDLLDGNLVLTANLDGPGLDLAFDGQLATLTAAGFDPNPFLDAPELLSPLSGSLSFKPASNSWTGELEGKIVFAGNDLGKVRLDGHSLPDNPELSLHFEGLSYDNGAWGLAPFVVDLAYDPASQQILITGGGANLQGGLDRIGGELELDLLAFGVSHKALLLVSNFPHQTRVEGRIEGELVQGEIRLVDQQLELQATIDPAAIGYLPQETGPIRIEASSGLDANWSARLESYLPLPGLPLQLTAEAKGVGLTYSGSGLLASAAPLLPFSFEGNATTARAEADLASLRFEQLAPLFPLPLELAPQGTLVFTTAPEPSLDFALSGQGTLAGEPFALNLVGVDTKAALQMTIAGNDLGEIRLDGYSLSGQGSIPPLSLSGLATVSQNWQLNGDLRQGRVDATLGDSSASLSWQESAWELTVAVVQNAALGPLVADLNGRYTLRQGDSPGSFAGNLVTTGTLLQLDGPLDHLSVRGGLDLPAIPGLPLPLLGRIELDGTADLPAGNLHSALSWLATGARLDGKLAVDLLDGNLVLTANLDGPGLDLAFDGQLATLTAAGFDPNPFLDAPELLSPLSGSLSFKPASNSWTGELEGKIVFAGNDLGKVRLDGHSLPDNPELSLHFEGLSYDNGAWGLAPFVVDLAYDPASQQILITGGGANLQGGLDRIGGELELDLLAFGVSHKALLLVSNFPHQTRVEGRIEGELVQGEIRLVDQQLELQATIDPAAIGYLPQETGPIRIEASSGLDANWSARLESYLPLPGLPLQLTAEAKGVGLTYSGSGLLASAAPLLPFSFEGNATTARAEADLASLRFEQLAPLFPLPLELAPQGTLVFTTAPEPSLDFALSGQGTLAGEPFALNLVGVDTKAALQMTIAGNDLGEIRLDGYSLSGQGSIPPLSLSGLATVSQNWQLNGDLRQGRVDATLGDSSASLSWQESAWELTVAVVQNAALGPLVADLNGRYTLRQGDSPGSFAGNLVTTGTLLQLDGPLDHLSVRGGLDLPAIPGLPLPLLGRIELDGTADLPAGNLHSALSWLATGARLDGKLAVDLLDGNLVLTANLDGPGLDLAFDGQLATLTAAGFDPNPFLDAPELLSPLSGSLSITGEVSADPDHLEHASFDLAADVAGISIGLAGQSPLLDLTISIPAGSRLPSTDLLTSVPVNLAGVADLSYNSLAVQGEIGPFILHANGELGNNVWSAAASLVATDRQLDATLSSADLALQGGLDLLSLSQVLALPIDFGSSDHLLVDIQGPWSALAGTVTAELALGSTLSTVSLSLDQQSLDVQGQIKAGGQVADLNGRYTLRQGDSPGSFAGNLVTTGTLLQLDGPLDHLSVRGGLDLPAIPGLPLPLLGRIELDGTADLPAGNLHSALSWLATGARLDGKLAVDLLDGNLVLTANLDGPGLDLAFDGQLATLTAAGFDPNPFLDAPELLSPLSGSLSFKPASNSWTGELEGKIVFAGNDLGKVRLDGHSLPDNPELSLHFEGLSYDNGAWGLAPFVVDLAYDPASQQILITGGGANLQGGLDRIGGELELDLLAFGVSHKALLLVSNFPHQTRVEGRIEGELVQGEIRLVDQQLELQATIDPAAIGYLPQETGPIRIEASSGLDANWSARLESYLPLPGLPLQLTAEAKGVGLTYSGSGLLASAAPLLPFSFEGNATTARAEADLASLRFEQLAPLFPLPLELAPQGTLVFTTAPEPSLDFALSGQGTLAGEPFALNLVGVDTKAALQMTIAGNDLGEIRLDGYSLSGQGSIPPLSLSGLATVSQNWQLNGDLRQGRVDATLGDSSASLSWQESAWELTVAVVQNAALGPLVADLNGRYTLRQGDSPGSFAGNLVTTGTLLQLDGPLDHLSVRGGLDLPAIPGLPLPLLGRIELDGTADLPAGNLHSALSWLATGARLDGKLAVDLLDGNLVLTANLDGPGLDLAFDGQLATLTAAGFDPNPFLDAPELLSPLSGSLSITGEVSADPDHLEHASFDLAADVAGISIGLAGQSPLLDLTISIPAGSRLPSTDLLTSVPVNLAGVADLSYNSLAVQGEIGPFILHANGELGNNVWSAAASLVATDRQLDATLSSADLALQGGLDLLSLSQVLALPIDFGSSDHLLVDIQGPWSALAGTVTAELALGSTLSTVSLSLDQQSLDVQGQIKAGGQVADLNGRYTLRQGDSPGSFAGNLVTTGTLLQLDGPLDHLSVRGGLDLPAIPGLPLPLLGRIELDGTADLPAGNLHSALSWLATGARLDGKLAVDLLDGNLVLTANLDGPGLDLAFDGQLATLTAAGFDPNPFLDAPELLSPLSGSLSFKPASNSWTGELEGKIVFAGNDLGKVRLDGHSLPDNPELSLHFEGLSYDNGAWGLAPFVVDLAYDPASQQILITGGGANLQGGLDRIGGELELDLLAFGVSHKALLLVSNFPHQTRVEGRIEGELVQGEIRLVDQQLELQATIDPAAIGYLPQETGPIRIEASSGLDANWSARLESYLPLPGLPLQLTAEAKGVGLTYSGSGLLASAAPLLPFSFEGNATTARAEADLASLRFEQLAPLFPLPLELAPQGTLVFTTAPEPSLDFALSGQGTLAGEPFALNLVGVDRKIALRATASGHELLVSWGEGRLELEVAGAALELTATATIAERNLQVAAGGLLQGTPVSATAGVKLADLSGDLRVGYGDAELTGQLSSEADRFTMDLQLLAPNGGPLPLPVEASLRLEIGAEGVRLTKLRARSKEVWGLEAEGVLSPELALSGRLDHPLEGLGPVELSGHREDSSLVISLAIDDLQGELIVSDGIRLAEATLDGVLSLPRYEDSIESFLSWTPKGGFAGRATAQLTPASGWAVALEATGQGELGVAIEVGGTSGPLARADAVLSERPWSDPSLTGRVELDLDAASLLGLPEGVALRLTGNPTLSGRLDSPEVAGDFQLGGILTATGYGLFDLAGGRIDLGGPGTSVTATATRSGWEARLDLEGLDIAAPLPAVREPRLDLQTQLSATWGGDPEGSVTRLILQTTNGRVSGRGRFDDDLEISLDLDAGLEDLLLPGLPLRGRLRGPLVVRGPLRDGLREAELTGSLELERAAVGGVAASLSGSLLVEGRVGDPGVQIDLSGEGAASGSVAGSIRPISGRVDLVSDLSFGSVATDLAIVRDEGAVRVHGGVDLGVGGFQTAPGTQEGNLFLGEGLFTGWRVAIRPAPLEAQITGDLESLTGSVAGRFDLRLSPPKAAGIWLEGGVEGVSLAGLDLGSATFSATTAAAEISGDRLAGSLRLADLAWSLDRLELDLPGPFLLGAAGSGRAAEGALDALVTGPNGETELPVAIRLDRDRLELGGRGRLLNGEVSLDLTAGAGLGWSGGVDLAGLRIAGGVLSASGRMSGALTRPELTGDLSWARGPFDLRGSATAGLDRVSFDQRLSGPDLDPLTLTGELWPQSRLTLSGQGPDRLVLEASQLSPAATVVAAGRLEFGFGPVDTLLAASAAGGLGIRISSAALEGLAAETLIPSGTLEQLLSDWQESGLSFRGTGRAAGGGSLQLGSEPKLRLEEFSYRGSGLAGTLSGTIRLGPELGRDLGGELSGVVELSPSIPWLPEVITATPLQLHLSATPGSLTLEVTSSLGPLELRHETASGSGSLSADLAWPGGSFEADTEYGPAARAGGVVRIRGLTWRESGPAPPLSLAAEIEVDSEALEGTVTVAAGGGTVRITGRWGVEAWGAEAFALTTSAERRLELRVAGVEPGRLPLIERITPNLVGKVNGVVQVRGNLYVGQLVAPTLSVLGTEFPAQVEFDGNPRSLTARGSVDRSTFTLTLTPESLTVVTRLERFPGEVAAKAVVGSVDVDAEITGILRFTLPWGRDEPGELRLATERVRLERDGVITEGNLSLSLFDGALTVDRAAFEGAGSWRAAGRVAPDRLEFQLLAEEADFTPLFGLVPQFAALGIGARGSLELRAEGTLGRPTVRASSSSLDLTAAGVLYRLSSGELELEGDRLRLAGELEGIDRLTGNLSLSGTGVLTLDPLLFEQLEVALTGEVTAPVLGSVEALEGRIIGAAGQGLRVEAAGLLGNPIWIEGSLSPLDLRLHGLELELSAPDFLVTSSRADLDLGVAFDRTLRLSGSVTAAQTRLSLGGRPPWASGRKPDPAWGRIVFDDLRLLAPQRVAVNESFANLELGLDFTLAGTVAAPRLSGRARALRGSFRFSGSSFDILSAEASFDPPRLPQIRVAARTSFDKAQVLAASAPGLEFVAPSGASRFDVDLAFEGEVSASETDDLPFVLDADPTLTSDAVIQETEGESPAVPRPLTEDELFSLITLGRLDLQSDLTGAAGLGSTVAQTALDTVFDLLFLSELQTALGEALGAEVVELRTTALSTILDESDGTPFGVSFRLGGYLSDDLAASYRIASYDDPDRPYALTNELRLTYGLGPFELDVAGRINFEDISTLQPVSELSVAIRYTILGGTSLETGLDLGGERQQLYFGVSFGF